MAGHPTNYDTYTIKAGSPGQIWAGLSIPAADAMLAIDPVTGTPDAIANPNAVHLGMTTEGSTATFELTTTDFFADEFSAPIKTIIEQINAQISGNFIQVLDMDVLEVLTSGFGTRVDGALDTDPDQLTLGTRPALTYSGVALIFPTEADPSKFAVVHLYDAVNTAGLAFQISRKGMADTPFNFKGRAITSRDPLDSLGNYWIQQPTVTP